MPLKILLLLFLSISLFADIYLKSNYYVQNREVMLSNIVKTPKEDVELFRIDKSRYSKKSKIKRYN